MGRTIAQKIYDAHRVDTPAPGVGVLKLDRVFCHEITTPIAINDLIFRGKDRVFDCDKIKAVIDHVTPAKDSKTAEQGKTLRDWAKRQKIKDFFDIGRKVSAMRFSRKKDLSAPDLPSSWVIPILAHTVHSVLSLPVLVQRTWKWVSSKVFSP